MSYDYGMGALWWFIRAESAEEILRASDKLAVHDDVPGWILEDPARIEIDDLRQPRSEALKLVLAGQE